jgi:predicted DNA binding CopG/RHH family protein
MRPVQLFTDEYLQRCRQATPEAILEFLESFRLMTDTSGKSKLISIKIPRSLLESFRRKCELEQIRYQTQIKILMEQWLRGE